MQRLPVSPASIEQAVTLLREGQVVAFPTDTAYGLGASPDEEEACRMIYRIKERASDQPLILLGDSPEQFFPFCEWSEVATQLAARFWPGALTLILPATSRLRPWVNSGGPSVGVRIPDHPVPREIARLLGQPFATTSANRSGHSSPRSGEEVVSQLEGTDLSLLLDGGKTSMPADSTIVDLVHRRILRAGGIPPEILEEVL